MRSTASFIRVIGFALLGYFFLDWVGKTGDLSGFEAYNWLWVVYGSLLLFYIAGEICITALQAILFKTLSEEKQEKYRLQEAIRKEKQFKWFRETYKKSLGSTSIEEEHEIILDHNYDGIKELDNKLPPWWVYGFYATILFAIIYLVRFEVFNDYNQDEEYEIAVAEAKIQIEEWKKTAKDLVDVNTVTVLTDASDLSAGKSIFTANCVACHKADGGGGIGPNLTDEYWILGGGIKNIFSTISEGGRDGKGMIAWKNDLKSAEMAQVASYILTFQGTSPAEPKAAEGELWVDPEVQEETTPEVKETITDSTTTGIVLNN